MKTKWLDRRIARPARFLTLCLSEEEFNKTLKSIKITCGTDWIKTPQAHATVHFLSDDDDRHYGVVCLASMGNRTPIEIAGLIIHESVHIFQEYCEFMGEHSPAMEQEAYGIQSISMALMAEYARRIKA